MAQGVITDRETLYKVMLCWFVTRNYSEVERRIGVPRKTVEKLVKEHQNDEEFTKLFQQKKEEFIETADRIINKATTLLEKRLDTALDNQDELEEMIYDVYNADKDEIKENQKKAIVQKLSKMQINSLNEITTALGTMYDKKQIAQNGTMDKETPVVNINIIDNASLEKVLYDEADKLE